MWWGPDISGMTPLYADTALETLRRCGITRLRAFCVATGCTHWEWLRVEDLLRHLHPGTMLVQLARRCVCRICGAHGCHVEIADPPRAGTDGYREWLQGEVRKAEALLAWAYSEDNRFRIARPAP